MANEMVERVVSAMKTSLSDQSDSGNLGHYVDFGDFVAVDGNPDMDAMARAAIEAMREPAGIMLDAGMDANPRGRTITDKDLLCMWRAMIDAELGDAQSAKPPVSPAFIEVIVTQIEKRGPVASMTIRPVHGAGEFMPYEFTIVCIDRKIADGLDVGLRYAVRIDGHDTKELFSAPVDLDRSDAADAARLRWMMNEHGYLLGEAGLCAWGNPEDPDKARRLIDKMMAEGE